jgi:hypothetical protein
MGQLLAVDASAADERTRIGRPTSRQVRDAVEDFSCRIMV